MFLYLERRRGGEKEGTQQREEKGALNGPTIRSCTPRHLPPINNTRLQPPLLPLLPSLLTALLFSICSFHLVLPAFLFILSLSLALLSRLSQVGFKLTTF